MLFSLACALTFLPLPVQTPSVAQTTQTTDRTWSLAPRWTSGQVTRYQTQTSFDLTFHTDDKEKLETTFQFGTDATLRYIVKKIESDGGLQVSVTSDGGKITDISGDTRDVPKEPANYPRLVTLNRWGTLRKLEDEGKNGKAANPLESVFDLTNLLVQLHFLSFPETPVKIGDIWTAKYPLPTIGKSEKGKGAKPDEKEKPEPEIILLNTHTGYGDSIMRFLERSNLPPKTFVGISTDLKDQELEKISREKGHTFIRYAAADEALPEEVYRDKKEIEKRFSKPFRNRDPKKEQQADNNLRRCYDAMNIFEIALQEHCTGRASLVA